MPLSQWIGTSILCLVFLAFMGWILWVGSDEDWKKMLQWVLVIGLFVIVVLLASGFWVF